jgi:hypothetical protein
MVRPIQIQSESNMTSKIALRRSEVYEEAKEAYHKASSTSVDI